MLCNWNLLKFVRVAHGLLKMLSRVEHLLSRKYICWNQTPENFIIKSAPGLKTTDMRFNLSDRNICIL